MTAIDRFMDKVAPEPMSGCWLWLGCGQDYGRFSYGGRLGGAHRFAYEHFVGPIPNHLQIDHICRVPSCVNPQHLRLVTSKQNTLLGVSPPAANVKKTTCKRGHKLSGGNVRTVQRGDGRSYRDCHQCRKAKDAGEVRQRESIDIGPCECGT